MPISGDTQKLLNQLKRDEGCVRDQDGRHVAYRCTAGKLTIGYGHNLDASPLPGIGAHSTLSEAEAERILEQDTATARLEVLRHMPWAAELDAARFGVLVNMAFNLGIRGLLGFVNTLRDVKNGDYDSAARRMLASKWARQVGARAKRLSEQMLTGVWV